MGHREGVGHIDENGQYTEGLRGNTLSFCPSVSYPSLYISLCFAASLCPKLSLCVLPPIFVSYLLSLCRTSYLCVLPPIFVSYGDGHFYVEVPYCTEKYPILRRDYRSTEKLHTVRQWPYWATAPGNTAEGLLSTNEKMSQHSENELAFKMSSLSKNEVALQKRGIAFQK